MSVQPSPAKKYLKRVTANRRGGNWLLAHTPCGDPERPISILNFLHALMDTTPGSGREWYKNIQEDLKECRLDLFIFEGILEIQHADGIPDPVFLEEVMYAVRQRQFDVALMELYYLDEAGALCVRTKKDLRPGKEIKGAITQEHIDAARAYPITSILGEKKIIRCISPDHDDRNPSMSINVRENYAKCFSCGFHADTIRAHMIQTGDSFPEAVKKLQKGS